MIIPGMGGGETFDELKRLNPGIKVLLSSGYSIDGQAQDIIQRECEGFLQKPFSRREFSIELREFVGEPAVPATFDKAALRESHDPM